MSDHQSFNLTSRELLGLNAVIWVRVSTSRRPLRVPRHVHDVRPNTLTHTTPVPEVRTFQVTSSV